MTEAIAAARPGLYDTLMLTDRAACERAIRWGGWAAVVNAALAGVFSVMNMMRAPGSPDGLLQLGGALLVAVLTFFVFRRSRTAATLLLLYYLLTKIMLWLQIQTKTGLVTGMVFIVFYFIAMRATYVWHARYGGNSA